jgi:glycosyltransferase involved in cell wall biosynthesis
MKHKGKNTIALFTIAVGKDPVYFNSVRRYLPYNNVNFGGDNLVDFFLLTDREETIEGMITVPCAPSVWPYTTMLKNNIITDYLDKTCQWDHYSHIFFIDADFAIGDNYNFFSPDFILVKPYWNEKNGGGFFYGGKTEYFRKLCSLFYQEIQFIYDNKLPPPRDLDEFYLGLFREQFQEHIHLIEMNQQTNTLIFYDNEDLDAKISETGKRLFIQPYKAEGRANKTFVIDVQNKKQECIVSLEEGYIFNNYTYDFGRLLKIDSSFYRIFWSKRPEAREVLNIETYKISKQPAGKETLQSSPVISVVMPVCNVLSEYLKESIESVLNQTFGDFELLIIDDGSTEIDGIGLINSYQEPRIRLIRNHHNFIDSLNKGIAESKGKYIARMDGDDIMLPLRLQVQYDFMEENPETDVCGSWMEVFGTQNRIVELYRDHKEIAVSLLLNNTMAHPTVMLRKSSVCREETNLYKEHYDCAEDYKLWTDLAIKGLRFANIPEVLLKYRSSDKQVTNIRQEEMFQSTLRIQMEYAGEVIDRIVEKLPQYETLFNHLITLFNEDNMSYTLFLQTVQNFYRELFQ